MARPGTHPTDRDAHHHFRSALEGNLRLFEESARDDVRRCLPLRYLTHLRVPRFARKNRSKVYYHSCEGEGGSKIIDFLHRTLYWGAQAYQSRANLLDLLLLRFLDLRTMDASSFVHFHSGATVLEYLSKMRGDATLGSLTPHLDAREENADVARRVCRSATTLR